VGGERVVRKSRSMSNHRKKTYDGETSRDKKGAAEEGWRGTQKGVSLRKKERGGQELCFESQGQSGEERVGGGRGGGRPLTVEPREGRLWGKKKKSAHKFRRCSQGSGVTWGGKKSGNNKKLVRGGRRGRVKGGLQRRLKAKTRTSPQGTGRGHFRKGSQKKKKALGFGGEKGVLGEGGVINEAVYSRREGTKTKANGG